MYFSKESRYRNMGTYRNDYRRSQTNCLATGVIAVVLLMCCSCVGVLVGLTVTDKATPLSSLNPFRSNPASPVTRATPAPTTASSSSSPFSLPNPFASTPKATATPDPQAPVPLKVKALGESGLEVTVTAFVRPLQVQGLTNVEPDQQFILVSLLIHNPKTNGTPIKIVPTEFQVKGDGGLAYQANPKIVTIDNLLTAQDQVAAGKDLDKELIFQIAKDDSGLQLYWTSGKTIRVFSLEAQR